MQAEDGPARRRRGKRESSEGATWANQSQPGSLPPAWQDFLSGMAHRAAPRWMEVRVESRSLWPSCEDGHPRWAQTPASVALNRHAARVKSNENATERWSIPQLIMFPTGHRDG